MASQQTLKLEYNVPVKMRDSTILVADILRPDSTDRYPAIIIRTPYSKDSLTGSRGPGYMNPKRIALAGYAVVIQDCRGTGVSEGKHIHHQNEPKDGYDTIEWAATQAWCDGNVGMYGLSYLGGVQWLAAIEQPPHLKAICPGEAAATQRGLPTCSGGVFNLQASLNHNIRFGALWLRRSRLSPDQMRKYGQKLTQMLDNIEEQLYFLPLKDVSSMALVKELEMAPFYTDWLEHIDDDEYWAEHHSPVPLEKITIPALHVTGWYDFMNQGVLLNFIEMQKRAGSELSRRNQKLVVGPWVHGSEMLNVVGDLNFGIAASGDLADITGLHIRWFDYWLKGIDNGIMDEPPVRIFIMGINKWRDEKEWPLARTRYKEYYLHSGGHANTLFGDGGLNMDPPQDEEPDVYLYDPRNPVPTKWGADLSNTYASEVQDQQELEKRPDVLVYSTPPLKSDIEVTGPILVKLWAASSAVDTDFTAKLVDVRPDGRSYNLVESIVRARYRESESEARLITPGEIYEYTIDLKATANVFKAGHCIRIEISSSSFPRYDRNLNTGHPIGQDAEIKIAVQTIYHNRRYPSHILLPIIPSKKEEPK